MINSKISVELGSNDGHFVMVVIWLLLHMFTTSNMVALLNLFWSFLGADNGVTVVLSFPGISSPACLLMTLFAIIIFIFIILISAITNFLHYIACVPIKTYLQTSA